MPNPKTPHFRVSYPNVFKAKRNDLSGKDEYSLVALFPKDADLSSLKAEASRAIKEKWGDKVPANIRSPFRKQDERAKVDEATGKKIMPGGHEEGAVFLNLKSSQKPGLVNERRETIIDESEFYAGCWAHATVRAYAYDNKGNRGVAFGLQNIQKVKDGDPLSGKAKAEDEFAPIETAGNGSSADSLFD